MAPLHRDTADLDYPPSSGHKMNAVKPSEPITSKLMTHISELRATISSATSRIERHADSIGLSGDDPDAKEATSPNSVIEALNTLESELRNLTRAVDRLFV